METATELLALAAQSGNSQLVLDSTWQHCFKIEADGSVAIVDVPTGQEVHSNLDAQEEEVLFQLTREEPRQCTCGSGQPWVNCSEQSQYCG